MIRRPKKISARKNTVILTISLILLILVNSGIGGLNDFVDSCMFHYLENRTVYSDYIEGEVDTSEYEAAIQKQKGVSTYFNYGMDAVLLEEIELDGIKRKEDSGYIYLESFSGAVMQEYLLGEPIQELADNEIIVARYANLSLGGIEDITLEDEIIDMKPYIGKTICGVVKKSVSNYIDEEEEMKTYEFKIVGVFDNIKAGKASTFYVNDAVRQEMLELENYHWFTEDDEGNIEYLEDNIYYQVIAEDYQSAEKIKHNLMEEFPDVICYAPMNFPPFLSDILKGIMIVGNFIAFYVIFNGISNVIFVTEDNLKKRRKEFGILRAIGYRDKDIRNILLKESLRSSGKAMGIAVLVWIVLAVSFKMVVKKNLNIYLQGLQFSVRPYVVGLFVLVGIGVPMIGFIYGYRKLKKMSVVSALQTEG